jgi:hypothetical protein
MLIEWTHAPGLPRSRRSRPVIFDITVVGVRSHTGKVLSVYLIDADIEKLTEFLCQKHD